MLASVNWRLSVLLKGDKGSGKSTASRGLVALLPAGAPFRESSHRNDRGSALGRSRSRPRAAGAANLKRGLIHEAHCDVLYIDEVKLLSDSSTGALPDAASSGRRYVKRHGF